MYCKKCGKQITDDSTFCKYCGEKQIGEEKHKICETKKKNNLTNSNKILIGIYVVWFLLNFTAIFLESSDYHPFSDTKYFFPWSGWSKRSQFDWNLSNYDISEFIVYAFIVPIVLYGVYWVGKKFVNYWDEQ